MLESLSDQQGKRPAQGKGQLRAVPGRLKVGDDLRAQQVPEHYLGDRRVVKGERKEDRQEERHDRADAAEGGANAQHCPVKALQYLGEMTTAPDDFPRHNLGFVGVVDVEAPAREAELAIVGTLQELTN